MVATTTTGWPGSGFFASAAWKAATGLSIYDGYGQTETVILIGNFRSRDEAIRPGSMGKPSPGFTVSVLDGELQEVPIGQEGEIAVRVKPHRPLGLFREYWRNPAETALRFTGDWYLTGDRARRDEAGYFWFVGRGDDVIKSSSYRIGPFEIESALIEHPAVLEAAVVGKADRGAWPDRQGLRGAAQGVRGERRVTARIAGALQAHYGPV